MSLVILGGTFNPVHIGHLFLAEEVLTQFGFEKVLLIPSNRPAHKNIEGQITSEQRLDMLRLAVESTPWCVVEPCEIIRGGISYSIDTVRCVLQKYPKQNKPALVIGDDLFEGFMTWKDAPELIQMSRLLVAHRLYSHQLQFKTEHEYINNKILPVSSSEIRQRVSEGKVFRHLVPKNVFEYISDHKLYTGVSS